MAGTIAFYSYYISCSYGTMVQFENRTKWSRIQMAFENQTIWRPDMLGPFENRTSPVFWYYKNNAKNILYLEAYHSLQWYHCFFFRPMWQIFRNNFKFLSRRIRATSGNETRTWRTFTRSKILLYRGKWWDKTRWPKNDQTTGKAKYHKTK